MAKLPVIAVIAAFVICDLTSLSSVHATTTYATNVTSGNVEPSSAVLNWLAPDDPTAAASYHVVVLNEQFDVVVNVTIADVALTSYTVTGLQFSTWHNVTLETLDATGATIGAGYLYFLTEYDALNFRALCAIGVVGGLIVVLLAVKIAAKICNPDKAAEKWKQEILLQKKLEREAKKKKFSSQEGLEMV